VRIDIITLFPGMFEGSLSESILKRAQEKGLLEMRLHDLRTFGKGTRRQVDDTPYGGGAGMVFRADVVVDAIESVCQSVLRRNPKSQTPTPKQIPSPKSQNTKWSPHRIYLSPRGKRLTQARIERLAKKEWLILLCGHYEGIDQRITDGWIDEEISIGPYVLTGGELPAMVLTDAVARRIPEVLGKEESGEEESFSKKLLRKREYPHYTKPAEFRGMKVPEILLSGNHAEIEKWRREHLT
jgi:tRNA (guanine37-N1)-methyltransferase